MKTLPIRSKESHALQSVLLCALLSGGIAHAQAAADQAQAGGTAAVSPAKTPVSFSTPQEAAQALIEAAATYNTSALLSIFGPEGKDLVASADPIRDKTNAVAFADEGRKAMSVDIDAKDPNRAVLLVGDRAWPFPVPLIHKQGRWVFDASAGRVEVLDRRIGANELDAIQVCRGFVEAQHDYASAIHDGSGVHQYAQRIISTPGKQDGLYWQNADGTPGGSISAEVGKAIEEGYSPATPSAYHGYYFKVLKGQGPAARMGQLDYVIEGVMIGGFALIAAPAQYRVTGVKTFIVGPDGIVYQKDLGPDTLNIAKKIERYNPDKTWQRTDDEWPP
jgi:hypothetical protein